MITPADAQLIPGELVRVRSSVADPAVGTFVVQHGDTLTLHREGSGSTHYVVLTRRSIVEAGRPRTWSHGLVRGAGLGAVAGAAGGAFLWGLFGDIDGWYGTQSRFFVPETMATGARRAVLPAAIAGALVGAINPGIDWERHPVAIRLTYDPTPGPVGGLRLSMTF